MEHCPTRTERKVPRAALIHRARGSTLGRTPARAIRPRRLEARHGEFCCMLRAKRATRALHGSQQLRPLAETVQCLQPSDRRWRLSMLYNPVWQLMPIPLTQLLAWALIMCAQLHFIPSAAAEVHKLCGRERLESIMHSLFVILYDLVELSGMPIANRGRAAHGCASKAHSCGPRHRRRPWHHRASSCT